MVTQGEKVYHLNLTAVEMTLFTSLLFQINHLNMVFLWKRILQIYPVLTGLYFPPETSDLSLSRSWSSPIRVQLYLLGFVR